VRRFAALYEAIDATTSTNAKVAALAAYFRDAPPGDAAWAVFFLTGRRLKRLVPWPLLREWTEILTGVPDWLVMESYAAVGDMAELIALLFDAFPAGDPEPDLSLADWVENRLLQLRAIEPAAQRDAIARWWRGLPRGERFILNKLLSGEFRVGVAQTLVVRALAQALGTEATRVAARLMGDWTPSAEWFTGLSSSSETTSDLSQPYPFGLAAPLDDPPESLGPREDWLVEWKWDGIRAQIVRRRGQSWVWSRGEELITLRFPEIAAASTHLPDGTVLDGEVLAFAGNAPMPFSALQQRIGRQRQVAQIMRAVPAVFMAFDVLEHEGVDIRERPLEWRRSALSTLVGGAGALRLSSEETAATWEDLAVLRLESRARGVEGFILKRRDSPYGVGRRRGIWWKWKIDPLSVDAVLIYAQPGSGKRASLLTDYTFGVWDGDQLVPVAKAYSGLSNEEIEEMDRWIRRHTRERHGPVRVVEPVHVFELGFEAIAPSTRHKSGVAVRFPRMLRWRRDKRPQDADTLDTLKALMPHHSGTRN
jgi:DNA ligase-1